MLQCVPHYLKYVKSVHCANKAQPSRSNGSLGMAIVHVAVKVKVLQCFNRLYRSLLYFTIVTEISAENVESNVATAEL